MYSLVKFNDNNPVSSCGDFNRHGAEFLFTDASGSENLGVASDYREGPSEFSTSCDLVVRAIRRRRDSLQPPKRNLHLFLEYPSRRWSYPPGRLALTSSSSSVPETPSVVRRSILRRYALTCDLFGIVRQLWGGWVGARPNAHSVDSELPRFDPYCRITKLLRIRNRGGPSIQTRVSSVCVGSTHEVSDVHSALVRRSAFGPA